MYENLVNTICHIEEIFLSNEKEDKFHFMEQHLKIIDEIVESSKYFR